MTKPAAGILHVTDRPVRRPSDRGKFGTNWQPGLNRQNPPSNRGAHPGGLSTTIEVTASGPWFRADVPGLIAGLIDEIVYAVASQALSNVQFNLDTSIQHPTPYYETQVRLDRVGTDMVVHDRGIVYGPWLEGTSSRNARSSFKGYHAFRRATQEAAHQAQPIADRVAADYIGREMT